MLLRDGITLQRISACWWRAYRRFNVAGVVDLELDARLQLPGCCHLDGVVHRHLRVSTEACPLPSELIDRVVPRDHRRLQGDNIARPADGA